MKLDDPGLENEFVRLEVLDERHRTLLEQTNAVESMWQWMPVIASGTNFHAYFDHTLELKMTGYYIPFAIWRKADEAFAGVVAFADISRTHRRLRLSAFWLREDMRGTIIGPATELALIERAQQSRIRRIEILIPASNERGIRAYERFGAQREGVVRSYIRVANGSWADIAVLSLVDEEIPAAQALLRDRIRELQLA